MNILAAPRPYQRTLAKKLRPRSQSSHVETRGDVGISSRLASVPESDL